MPSRNLSFTFHEGVLHLTTPQGEMRLRWNPEPLAEKRLLRSRWDEFVPEFRILAPDTPNSAGTDSPSELLRTKQEAFRAFRSCLPADHTDVVESFGSHQWPLLVLARNSTSGTDLLHSNPILAYALANNAFIQKRASPSAPSLAIRHSHSKHREILGWLDFPATDAMARIFNKIPPAMAHPALLRKLRQAAKSPEALKIFSHLQKKPMPRLPQMLCRR